ncbi:MAG: hypothetical protein ACLUIQ_09750 [Dialister invisus]
MERVIERRAILPETLSVKSSPNDHPATGSGVIIMKEISALSGGRVTIKNNSDVVQINKRISSNPPHLPI